MIKRAGTPLLRRLLSAALTIVLLIGLSSALSSISLADDGPKPDPSGAATGDKAAAVDAAGNPFVVPELSLIHI